MKTKTIWVSKSGDRLKWAKKVKSVVFDSDIHIIGVTALACTSGEAAWEWRMHLGTDVGLMNEAVYDDVLFSGSLSMNDHNKPDLKRPVSIIKYLIRKTSSGTQFNSVMLPSGYGISVEKGTKVYIDLYGVGAGTIIIYYVVG